MKFLILTVQTATFVGLGGYFIYKGEDRLGAAQLLLAGVNVLIYA